MPNIAPPPTAAPAGLKRRTVFEIAHPSMLHVGVELSQDGKAVEMDTQMGTLAISVDRVDALIHALRVLKEEAGE
jgi:hypothetical protein